MTLEQCFMGLADRTRLRILHLLLRGELCGCDIQHVLEVSQSAVSRHLNYLKRAGLVLDRREGYRVYYRLATAGEGTATLLFEFLRRSFAQDTTFATDLKALKAAVREGACTISEARTRPRSSQTTAFQRRRAMA